MTRFAVLACLLIENSSRAIAAVLVLAVTAGCATPVYRARLVDLRAAEVRWAKAPTPIAIPAFRDGEQTYVNVTHLRYVVKQHDNGEVDLVVRDTRPAMIAGGLAVIAVAIGVTAASVVGADAECERRDRDDLGDCLFATPFLQGLFYGTAVFIGGSTLTIMGLVGDGPEMRGPSPGFLRHDDKSKRTYGLKAVGTF